MYTKEQQARASKRYRERHPERLKANYRNWADKNPIKLREKKWFHEGVRNKDGSRFLWTDYQKLLTACNKECTICHSTKPGGIGDWHVDHNHITGEARGVLCFRCNHGLGCFRDSLDLLRNACKYLELSKT